MFSMDPQVPLSFMRIRPQKTHSETIGNAKPEASINTLYDA